MDSPLAFFPQIPAIDNTYGAVLLGSNFSLMCVTRHASSSLLLLRDLRRSLYGFNLHQAYRYIRQFPNDSRFVKTVVCSTSIILFEVAAR